jgi:hypothetical protein
MYFYQCNGGESVDVRHIVKKQTTCLAKAVVLPFVHKIFNSFNSHTKRFMHSFILK